MPLLSRVADLATIAYFSMEVGFDPEIPTYSGGLGVLAGDTLRAAADLGLEMVGISLLHRHGYFRQHLDSEGNQIEEPCEWEPGRHLEEMTARATVTIEGRPVTIRAWRRKIVGLDGDVVPLYLLDTDLVENSTWDRTLTDDLYGGDARYRLGQEAILGLGGVAMLRALGHGDTHVYHLNEGHSALLTLDLLEGQPRERSGVEINEADRQYVRHRCVFTTHTPVPAGHDQFPWALVRQVLGDARANILERVSNSPAGVLNMTDLALNLSHYTNGVALRHGEVSRGMFPGYPIDSITNGVHTATWTSAPFARLFDRHLPDWRRDNFHLRYAVGIAPEEVHAAHAEAKLDLLDAVKERSGISLDPHVLTIGFARRATGYKRPDLLFRDPGRLRDVIRVAGPLQIIYSGKAHPRDDSGRAAIRRVYEAAAALRDAITVVYLEDYDMTLARLLCSGVDLWLNTPQKPFEASGTSGMKAALNGVPCLSVLDGWWIEGHVEGVTGWSIGETAAPESDLAVETQSLYDKLERVILPLFYRHADDYARVMRSVIALNGGFFHVQRMLLQYVENAYLSADRDSDLAARAIAIQQVPDGRAE